MVKDVACVVVPGTFLTITVLRCSGPTLPSLCGELAGDVRCLLTVWVDSGPLSSARDGLSEGECE